MSCTLAAPPGTPATMRSISLWLSVASVSMSGVMASQPGGMRLGGTTTPDVASARRQPSRLASDWRIGCAQSVGRPSRRRRSTNFIASSEWPPSCEEIILDADALEAEDLGEDAAQRRLRRVARRDIAARDLRIEVGSRKRLAVDLAIGRQGQRVERDEGRRDHIVGQLARQRRAQLRRLQRRAAIGDHIGDEPLLAAAGPPARERRPRAPAAGARAPPRSRRARCGSRGS